MTNAQLYVAICVPVLAMIFAMVTNFALISRVDKRIDEMGARLDKRLVEMGAGLDKRLDEMDARLDKRIDEMGARLDKRIEEMGARLDKRIDELGSHLEKRIDDVRDLLRAEMQRDHSEVMAKFADVERRLERLESERRVIQ